MILTIDVGNTNIVIVGYKDKKKVYQDRFATNKNITIDELKETLRSLDTLEVQAVVLSNVVPIVKEVWRTTLEAKYPNKVLVVSAESVPDFKSLLDNPFEIGSDFIATSVAIHHKYKEPCIMVDIGSATKMSLTDDEGVYRGGVIIPGLKTSVDAFLEFLPHLPPITDTLPNKVIGTNTIDAIASGVYYGLISEVEGLTQRIESEYGKPCLKVLTGGYSNIIKEAMPDYIFDSDLLNEGLYYLYLEDRIK